MIVAELVRKTVKGKALRRYRWRCLDCRQHGTVLYSNPAAAPAAGYRLHECPPAGVPRSPADPGRR